MLRSTPTATRWASRRPAAGKTIMLSAVAGELLGDTDAKACVLAHRDELTDQNRAKFARVNPGITTSVVDANEKSWDGQVDLRHGADAVARLPTSTACRRSICW